MCGWENEPNKEERYRNVYTIISNTTGYSLGTIITSLDRDDFEKLVAPIKNRNIKDRFAFKIICDFLYNIHPNFKIGKENTVMY